MTVVSAQAVGAGRNAVNAFRKAGDARLDMVGLRGFFTWFFTPLARRLVDVPPNVLTGVSVLAGCGAGVAFWLGGKHGGWYAAAAACLAASGAADSLDGLVARQSGRVSRLGELFDHVGDRVIEVAVLGGIIFVPGTNRPLGVAVLVLTLLHSYFGTQIEATFGVRDYSGPGKAEQFVGLIVFSLVLFATALPGFAWRLAISPGNLFFTLLGIGTALGIVHRVTQAWRLGRAADTGHGTR